MASELRDRLTDLADHTRSAAPPPDLWTRGVRRRRAGQAATSVLVAALVLVLGGGAWSWRASQQAVTPVAPQGTPHLPDRIYEPSPWLHGFAAPPGQLVALWHAERKSLLHTTDGLVGVTASTAEYGFLDLPGALEGAVLSPDGRRIAYWAAGPTTGDPSTVADGRAIGSLVVYDTSTGQVTRHSIATVHGLVPEELIWTGAASLYVDYFQHVAGDNAPSERRSLSRRETSGVWDASTGIFKRLRLTPPLSSFGADSAPGAPLVLSGDADSRY